MARIKINEPAFAFQIKQYFDTHKFDMKQVDSALRTCLQGCEQESYFRLDHKCNGLRFDYTGELMLLLLERAYTGLSRNVGVDEYCARVAKSMQRFGDGFGEDVDMCYPHFLMHGIDAATLDGVVNKIEENARIIHETRTGRRQFIDSIHLPLEFEHGLKIGCEWGQTDDYFGMCFFLYDSSIAYPCSISAHLAKFSTFTDVTNKTVYGLTVQGKRIAQKKIADGVFAKDKKSGREFARITARIGMDPRAFVIKAVADLMRSKGYEKIKVVKPQHHPMFIEQHKGFTGKYGPIIRQAGIQQENGCYLESDLNVNYF